MIATLGGEHFDRCYCGELMFAFELSDDYPYDVRIIDKAGEVISECPGCGRDLEEVIQERNDQWFDQIEAPLHAEEEA